MIFYKKENGFRDKPNQFRNLKPSDRIMLYLFVVIQSNHKEIILFASNVSKKEKREKREKEI